MKANVLANLAALAVVGFVGMFIWGTLRTTPPVQTSTNQPEPTAAVSEAISDGRVDVSVFVGEDRAVRLEIRFTPEAGAIERAALRPDVSFAMTAMHMDGLSPPLESVETAGWNASIKLPMAGRWIVSVGFGEEFAEVEFDVR